MSFHKADFGKDVVSINGDDIFFLDTNIVITYLYNQAEYHEATLLFIRYLLFKRVVLCISEVVVMEALNGLARELYVNDQISQPDPSRPSYYRSRWGQHVIKNDPNTLSDYHRKANRLIEPFLDVCIIVEAGEEQVRNAMDISVKVPLGSADALIVSSALSVEAKGILSLDRDMEKVNIISIYTTTARNTTFNGYNIINKLGDDFKNYLISLFGEKDFHLKYSPKSTIHK